MGVTVGAQALLEGGAALQSTLGEQGVRRLIDGIVAREGGDGFVTTAPATGLPLFHLPRSSTNDVVAAADAARAAQADWAARPVVERAAIIGRVHDAVLDARSLACDMVQLESGKARRDAFEEVAEVALAARYCSAAAPRLLAPHRRAGVFPVLTRAYEYRHPVGLVGVISPWNYPLTLAVSDALPAFVAGNAVLHKPDEQSVVTALLGRSIAVGCGLPPDLWQVVVGDGPTIGGALLDQVDYASFTGSTATGRVVAAQMGRRLRGVSLELGGKNPVVVLADGDLDKAAAGTVRACFANAGQLCISMERIYVDAAVHDDFVQRLVAATRAVRLGTTLDFGYEVGSLQSPAQLDKVLAHIEDARAGGARVLAGGRHRPDVGPYVVEPTLLADVRPGMLAVDTETFGPVASVYPFADEDELVAAVNGTPYGLNASIWTGDAGRGVALSTRFTYGSVNVNEAYGATFGSHALPMGGRKDSGLHRRHGDEGITRFTDVQAVAVQRGLPLAPVGGMSYERYADVMTTMLKVLRRAGRA